MTPAFLTPQNLRPFPLGAERQHSVNAKSNKRMNPTPSRPAASVHAIAPLPTRHRGAQAVTSAATGQAPKLLDQMSNVLRTNHYSIRTEKAYIDWIYRFILFHGKRHPRKMGVAEIGQFLTHLAQAKHVAPSTQNQALCAIFFV